MTAHPAFAHASVLAADVARLLGGCRRVVDGTVGAGGHARLLLDAGAEVLAFDRDPAAVAAARDNLGGRVTVRRLEFSAAARDSAVAAFHPDGRVAELFRYAGKAAFKGLAEVPVWEICDDAGAAGALGRMLGPTWFGRAQPG